MSLATWRDYVVLLKPRVMSLVIFTGLVGLLMAPGSINPVIAAAALICMAVGAGASGALNMWYDADIDRIMGRTRRRPIPLGRVSKDEALAFGAFLSFASVAAMGLLVNLAAAGLLALTIAFYLFVYTIWLKRRTPQNIVIGGAAGAFPPMIGWAAVTGGIAIEPIILFAIIFTWTPPHFWALALYRAGDYEKAGVPMMPVVAGEADTRLQILLYAVALWAVTVAPVALGFAGVLYAVASVILGGWFTALAAWLWWLGRTSGDDAVARTRVHHVARRLFRFSILYLFLIFLVLGFEPMVGLAP
ncbi:MAG: heme o synthase [Alphaproteobacteria bacterium]